MPQQVTIRSGVAVPHNMKILRLPAHLLLGQAILGNCILWRAMIVGHACRCQEIDLFGEIGGITFSPDGSSFFVSIADVVYSSLQEYVISQDWRPKVVLSY